jgi:hypothetical protein
MKFGHSNITEIEQFLGKSKFEINFSVESLYKLNKILFAAELCKKSTTATKVHFMSQGCEYMARDLLKIKYKQNDHSAKNIKEGFVYAITNPAWPEYVKIGCAIDVFDRLSSYQTSSPKRDYKLEAFVFVEDRLQFESYIHNKYECDGEWVKDKTVLLEFKLLKKSLKDKVKKIVSNEYIKSIEICKEVLNEPNDFRKFERIWMLSKNNIDKFSNKEKIEIRKALRINSSWKRCSVTKNGKLYDFSLYGIKGFVSKDKCKVKLIF